MGTGTSREPLSMSPDGVYILMYEWTPTSNSALNSVSTGASKSLSDAKCPHCTSIVAFGCEYYFDSSGITCLYEPGGLHKKLSREPLIVSNLNRSESEWNNWVNDQRSADFASDQFNFELNNWNNFVIDAAKFFGLDLTIYPDIIDILNEPKEMKKKFISGSLKTAGVASKIIAQVPIVAAGNPVTAQVIATASHQLLQLSTNQL